MRTVEGEPKSTQHSQHSSNPQGIVQRRFRTESSTAVKQGNNVFNTCPKWRTNGIHRLIKAKLGKKSTAKRRQKEWQTSGKKEPKRLAKLGQNGEGGHDLDHGGRCGCEVVSPNDPKVDQQLSRARKMATAIGLWVEMLLMKLMRSRKYRLVGKQKFQS